MAAHLVRHACAGERADWDGDDAVRPLDRVGTRQAAGIADALADVAIGRIVSSPAVRCTQTVGPLARIRGVEVEVDERLTEGSDPQAVLELLLGEADLVACTHGDIVPEVLRLLRLRGFELEPTAIVCAKGSRWTIDVDDRGTGRARYSPPPG